jgi:hypothetical protein
MSGILSKVMVLEGMKTEPGYRAGQSAHAEAPKTSPGLLTRLDGPDEASRRRRPVTNQLRNVIYRLSTDGSRQ